MAADRSLGGVTQGLARCVEAESVKKCGLASKGSAPRQKVRPRALTDQPERRLGDRVWKTGSCWIWTKRALR